MALGTCNEIRAWVHENYGFKPQDCWIYHCKELAGLPLKRRYAGQRPRERQCPPDKRVAIFRAFSHFGLLPQQ